ncbi:MAG TPA: phosphatidic acid phosphatase [Ruminococcaceae bacterium]|nr:phosphatidic acid phosphatase [Oscillospiraceae bacterium]
MELAVLKWIQSFSSPFLDVFFQLITMLAEQWTVILVLAAAYWLYDKKAGEQLAFTLLISGLCNNILKGIFRFERPIGQEGIRTLRAHTATGYSFPSGHSQNASTLYFSMARRKGGWLRYALASAVCLLVGLSRLYLGVHYPKDAAVGLVLGAAFAFLCPVIWNRVDHEKCVGITAAICLILTLLLGQRDLYKVFGLLLGFGAGIAFERRYVNFSTQVSGGKKALRFLLGLVLLGGVQYFLKMLFPHYLWCDAARYALLVFFAFGVYPFAFHKAGF